MASIEADSISTEEQVEQPETHPPQNVVDTDSVSVNLENPISYDEQSTKTESNKNKLGSLFLKCYELTRPKPFKFLCCCLLFVCFAPVAYAIITVVTVGLLPLLLVAFVVIRLFQIIVRTKDYGKRFLVTLLLRYWILAIVMLLLIEVGIFYPIAKYVPRLKLVMIIGLPITKWINIICILIGIYLIGQFIWFLVMAFTAIISSGGEDDEEVNIFIESISEIFGCLLALWANEVVMSSVPIITQSKIFGIYTHKWVKVSLFLLIGYNIITLLTYILVLSLPKFFEDRLEDGENIKTVCWQFCDISDGKFNKRNILYVAIGIKRSIISILSMAMLLITWVVYFDNRLDTTPENKRILEIGTWSFVSLLICSFLWLCKSCILLYWETHNVYHRLHPKIRDIGKRLYFLIMLSYKHHEKIMEYSAANNSNDSENKLLWILPDCSDEDYICHELDRKIIRAEFINFTAGKDASIYDIQKAAQRFLTAQNALSNERTVGDLHHLQGNNDSAESNANCIKILKKLVQVEDDPYFLEDWEMLLKLLPDVETTEEITFQKVKIFMERAHSSCMFLTNTLMSENEVVKCLNQVMSGVIIGVIFIMWLLLTGLASTKVLVIIASPALAATFIFGDTAKGLFQGLIFVYVVHPFDVGDLCLIDGELLEVKRIGIWSTIFSNIREIGEQEQIIYPNSVLSLKNVINHKTNFNWKDCIEILCSPDKKITEPLKHKLEIYLRENEKFTPNFHSVEIRELGDKAKIAVHIKHKFPTTEGWTYFECLKEKEKRRFELAIYVQNLVKQLEFGAKAPESAEIEDFYTRG